MDNLAKFVGRDKVNQIEAMMLQLPQIDMEVRHHFSQGVYARELHIPKGVTLTGKIHKYEQLNILAKGRIKVLVDGIVREVEAPFIVVSPPGTKRVAHALEDCVWITVHGTEEKDLNIIEQHFIAQNENDYLEFKNDNQLKLGL